MVAEAVIAVSPDADVQAGGSHTPLREAHHADRFTADRVLNSDLVRLELRPDSSYRDVPAAVDDEPRVRPEAVRHGVRAKALDRKSTRLNSSHRCISYAVFCL